MSFRTLRKPYSKEAMTLFAAFTVQPPPRRKYICDRLIRRLISERLWSKIALMYVHAAADSQSGRVDWKNPGSNTLTLQTAPAFTADVGFNTGAASAHYLDVGSGYSSFITQDDHHLGAWVTNTGVVSVSTAWGRADANGRFSLTISTASNLQARLATANGINLGANTTIDGYFVTTRRASNAVEGYINGASNGTATTASEAVGTGNILLLNSNSNLSTNTMNIGISHIGVQLSTAEILALYAAFSAYRAGL